MRLKPFLIALLCLISSIAAHAQTTRPLFKENSAHPIPGPGGWDYLTIDPDTQLLYLPRGDHLQVIDTSDWSIVADLPKCGAHGVVLLPELNKGFTSDGPANTVTAFDLKANKILYTVPTGHNPDAILYDPASKKIFTFDGQTRDATVISPTAEAPLAVLAHIPLDGKPESAASDTAGSIYVNIEDKNEIQVIDSKSMIIKATWKLPAQSPTGLAIDPITHHLFVGCENKMLVLNGITGKTLASLPIGPGVDACAFDPQLKLAFASCEDGTLAIIKETSPQNFEKIQTLSTRPSARTLTLDPSTHTLYLPFAKLPADTTNTHHAEPLSGTFAILVLSPPDSSPTTEPIESH